MLKELDNYDWGEAFKYADFPRENVVEIIAIREGQNHGDSWCGVFKLKSGEYAYLTAWCDYTGWGCQESGNSYTDKDKDNLIKMKITKADRMYLGLTIPEDYLKN